MLNINKELEAGTIFAQEVKTFTPDNTKFDTISYLPPTRKIQDRIDSHAKLGALSDLQELEDNNTSSFFVDHRQSLFDASFERNRAFWAVVFSLAVGNKRAFEYYSEEIEGVLGIKHVADLCENKLSELGEEFDELANEILLECGMIKEELEDTDIIELAKAQG